jgi:hypothetical protein
MLLNQRGQRTVRRCASRANFLLRGPRQSRHASAASWGRSRVPGPGSLSNRRLGQVNAAGRPYAALVKAESPARLLSSTTFQSSSGECRIKDINFMFGAVPKLSFLD